MKKIGILFAFALLPLSLFTLTNTEIILTEADLPGKYTLVDEFAVQTVHPKNFYEMPSMQGTLPVPMRKTFQTLAVNKKPVGSLLYFEYEEGTNLLPVISFLRGLLWSSHRGPSADYPEEIYVYKNILIILSFPYNNPEQDIVLDILQKKTGYELRNELIQLEHYESKTYSVPGAGSLVLKIPEPFHDHYNKPDEKNPATLDLYIPESKEYSINIALYPSPGGPNFYDSENLRRFLKRYGYQFLENAVEDNLEIKELTGLNRTGFYYVLTDKELSEQEVPEGRFRYFIQGGIRTGEVLISFVILSRDKQDSKEIQALFKMLKLAHYSPSR